MTTPSAFNERLAQRRAAFLARLGTVSEQVVSRQHPLGGEAWPASVLGRMRIVRRPETRLLVTDGLSSPFDPELHPHPPPGPLDFELAVDVPSDDPCGQSDAALAQSWLPSLLYALTDWIVPEYLDLRGLLEDFRAVTLAAPATTGAARALAGPDGLVGVLIGLPLVGQDLDRHPYLNGYYQGSGTPYADAALGFFPVKPLTPDEYAWAKAQGDRGGVLLAQKFMARGDAHRVFSDRPSVLEVPTF